MSAVGTGGGVRHLLHPDRVFDGEGVRTNALVVVEGDRIVDLVAPSVELAGHPGYRRLPGATLLPGLIDAHAHLGVTTMGPERSSIIEKAAQIIANAGTALDLGYTTLRDLGGVDGGLAGAIETGTVRGPSLLPSGPLLCQSGGHGDTRDAFAWSMGDDVPGLAGLHQFSLPCDGADGIQRGAREAFRRGASQLKLCLSGGIVSHSDALEDVQLTAEEIRAAVGEADARGTYVTAHAFTAASIRHGMANGVSCFEHGTFLDEETAVLMAQADVPLVPTLSVVPRLREHQHEWGIPDSALARLDEVQAANARSVHLAIDAGVRVGSGSDAIGPDQSGRSLELVVKCELLGAEAALRAATSVNASILRLPDRGRIEGGMRADLVLVDGDPLTDVTVLLEPTRIALVVKAGEPARDRDRLWIDSAGAS